MKKKSEIIDIACKAIFTEAQAIHSLIAEINDEFCSIIELLLVSKGRIIVTGIGKSAIIAQKMVATLNSTGSPAIFLHAADAIHGDLGMIQPDDHVICISKSGNTSEIKVLVPLIKSYGNKLIGMVADKSSYLAQHADYLLYTPIDEEACPHNLAPTTSTTAQLVMGDALAICLLSCKDFKREDFAKFHPGGALGKKLYLTVGEMAQKNERPEISPQTPIKEVIIEISRNRLGAVVVLENNEIQGIITDGDIRRMLQKNDNFALLKAKDIMSVNPKQLDKNTLAVEALDTIKNFNITQLLITDQNTYFGLVHLHDFFHEGMV